MWTKGLTLWRFTLCMFFVVSAFAAVARADDEVPSESQCRPYIEKALKELESGDVEPDSAEKNDSSEVSVDDGDDTKEAVSAESGGQTAEAGDSGEDDAPSVEIADEPYIPQGSIEVEGGSDDTDSKEEAAAEDVVGDSKEQQADEPQNDGDSNEETASADDETAEQESAEKQDEPKEETDDASKEGSDGESQEEKDDDSKENEVSSQEAEQEAAGDDNKSGEAADASEESKDEDEDKTKEDDGSQEKADKSQEESEKQDDDSQETKDGESKEAETESEERAASVEEKDESGEEKDESGEEKDQSAEDKDQSGEDKEQSGENKDDSSEQKDESQEDTAETGEEKDETAEETTESVEEKDTSAEEKDGSEEGSIEGAEGGVEDKSQEEESGKDSKEEDGDKSEEASSEGTDEAAADTEVSEDGETTEEAKTGSEEAAEEEGAPEEDLLLTGEIPENLRSRDHISKILRLDEETSEAELTVDKSAEVILRDLKRLYENSIKPLEGLYKYRDLSNRHFGDPEIFSKPLILFMGPWSGGKSSILNYLTGIEFTEWSLRTGAEPSPAYFNILMHGKDPQVLDGTQLAADWTFSGLQKFGQGLEERLRGLRYPSKILEKVNIVEIPGILEVRKQVSRVFPFNDACQWFIDRADIIFLVYDPSKLDVGPETEAILDQLKGRESQTRIVLNKADTVKPEELMRVQSALIWNISPLMSSAQPPAMYTVSLWSIPFEAGAPVRLLQAQERELLRDLRQAIDKRIENKISSARRFAVRVRNHAKMVDCYLTTYYNHKTIFGNRKLIADAIIESPQTYHIYEGLSTLTNISRYDLPDPETYRDFFRLNPLYEFSQLSATCTYFRGCPITRLDVAIAYDLPELVGKYKKMVETSTPQGMPKS